MDTQKNTAANALVMVHLRNEFYKTKYYLVLGVYILSLVVIVVLGSILFFLLKNPTHPFYYAADSVGRLIKEVPVQFPNMSTDEVAAWAVEAVEAAYSYDFVNYRAELQEAQKYFTDYGWRKYIESLTESNNLLALTQRRLVIIAKVVDKPQLIVEGPLSGAYAWKFQMPVLTTNLLPPYDGKLPSFTNPLMVSVIVQRQKLLQSYKGLGILQMIGTLQVSPTAQPLTTPPSQ